jgi:hypothetical protein
MQFERLYEVFIILNRNTRKTNKNKNKMNIQRATKITFISVAVMLLIGYLYKVLTYVPYGDILDKNENFLARTKPGELTSVKFIKVPRRKVDDILKDTNAKYIVAIVGTKGRALSIDVAGLDKNNNVIFPNDTQTEVWAIKMNHKNFKTNTKHDAKTPIGFKDFPLIIKMDKSEIDSIGKQTLCVNYLLFPCEETEWSLSPNDNIPDSRKVHFTIGVLGSDKKDGNIISPEHTRANSSRFFLLFQKPLALAPGAETWPYENFSWYYMSNTDPTRIEIPDTEPQ